MNTKLESLLQTYSDSPTLRTQQAIENFYIVSYQDRPEIQKRLIDFVKNNNVKGGGIEWSNFFSFDKEFCKEIILAVEENNAKKQLKICLDNKNKVFIELAVDLCLAISNNYVDISGMSENIENVWLHIFKDMPDFKEILAIEKAEKIKRYNQYYKNIETPIEEITIKTLEIYVPIEPKNDDNSKVSSTEFEHIKLHKSYLDFMEERIEYFNNFDVEHYMEIKECQSVKMRVDGDNNIFTISLKAETDENKLKEALLDKLSAGIGDSLSGSSLLIKDKIYRFCFDTKNPSEFLEIGKKKNKFKM